VRYKREVVKELSERGSSKSLRYIHLEENGIAPSIRIKKNS
jgi:hypothetical protein